MPDRDTSSRTGDHITYDPESDFRILIATDNHLGYGENNLERGMHFLTFDQVQTWDEYESISCMISY
jgi:hypothetical protein